MRISEIITERWSQKYKSSINCSHPKGFSQKAHCAGKKKHNESVEMEMTCPDCGMCETHGNTLNEIKKGQKDSNGYTKCWPGKHAEGTKKGKNGKQVRNCVPNESLDVKKKSKQVLGTRRHTNEATDPKFLGFMNKALGDKADPAPTTTKLPSEYSKFQGMNFDNMPGYKPAFKFGLNVLKAMDQKTRQHFINASEDDLIDYIQKIADKKGLVDFEWEDLEEVTDWFDEIFADPNLHSWTDLLKSMSGNTGPNESLDADQKRVGQVGGKEKAKNISTVLGTDPKQHPFKGRLVGEASITNPGDQLKSKSLEALIQIKLDIEKKREADIAAWKQDFEKNVVQKAKQQLDTTFQRTPVAQAGEKYNVLKDRLVQLNVAIQKHKELTNLINAIKKKYPLVADRLDSYDEGILHDVRAGAKDNYKSLIAKLNSITAQLMGNFPGAVEKGLNEFAPGNGAGESGRWYTDDQMTDLVGDGWWNDLDISGAISKQQMIQEAQAWLADQGYSVQVLNCKVNDDNMEWYIEGNLHNPGFAKKGVTEGPFVQRIVSPNKINVYVRSGKKSVLVATDISYNILDKYINKVIEKYPQFKPADFSFKPVDKVTEGYGKYWCSTDKRWKERKGPKQTRSS